MNAEDRALTDSGPVAFYGANLLRNLKAGVRLAAFMRLGPLDYRASPVDLAVLFVFNLLFWIGIAAVRAGFVGEFDANAVVVYLATLPVVLIGALTVALIYRAPQRFPVLAVALLASDPFFELVSLGLPKLSEATGTGQAPFLVYLAWIWVTAVRAVVVCGGRRKPEVYAGSFVITGMIAVAMFAFPRAEVWQAPGEEAEPVAALSDERLFHLQGELIERSLAAINAGRPGKPELYFVGFAPDASQDVFLREMQFVKRLFDERFATAGRSVALASSHTALEELPIASTTNLARALARVGSAMNAEEDVLFLYVSAHGDHNHRLSASQPPLELASLTPTALARMLQDSGIKYRVIVVSACFGGGFIEPLRDDNTMVITASAADRHSFGCETGRDFTYFGEALFRDGLAKERAFAKAFEHARDLVSKREAAEKLTPSQPQIFVGREIEARLAALALEKPGQ